MTISQPLVASGKMCRPWVSGYWRLLTQTRWNQSPKGCCTETMIALVSSRLPTVCMWDADSSANTHRFTLLAESWKRLGQIGNRESRALPLQPKHFKSHNFYFVDQSSLLPVRKLKIQISIYLQIANICSYQLSSSSSLQSIQCLRCKLWAIMATCYLLKQSQGEGCHLSPPHQ